MNYELENNQNKISPEADYLNCFHSTSSTEKLISTLHYVFMNTPVALWVVFII